MKFLKRAQTKPLNLGYKFASVSFHFTKTLPNKKNGHKVIPSNWKNQKFSI